jgi:hypothetical protein
MYAVWYVIIAGGGLVINVVGGFVVEAPPGTVRWRKTPALAFNIPSGIGLAPRLK